MLKLIDQISNLIILYIEYRTSTIKKLYDEFQVCQEKKWKKKSWRWNNKIITHIWINLWRYDCELSHWQKCYNMIWKVNTHGWIKTIG